MWSSPSARKTASDSILAEMEWWEKELESQGRLVESQRIHQRTRFDLRDDQVRGLLPRHRELFAALLRAATG